MTRSDRNISGGYEPSSANEPSHSFTAAACRSAAAIWREDGIAAHRNFAPVLDTWADRAEARAAATAFPEQPDLFTDGADQ